MLEKNSSDVCFPMPLDVHSKGFFKAYIDKNVAMPLKHPFPALLTQSVLIFITTQACHFVLKRFGLPEFISQVLAGIILSPSLVGRNTFFKDVLSSPLLIMACSGGFYVFMFVNGAKMDLSMIFRTGRKAWVLGIATFFVPVAMGLSFAVTARNHFLSADARNWPFFVATVQSFTSFPVISSLLYDLKIVNSELGRLGLSAALISDMCSTVFLAMVNTEKRYSYQLDVQVFKDFVMFVAIMLAISSVFRLAMVWVIKRTPEDEPIKEKYIYILLTGVFSSSFLSQRYTNTIYLGAYLLGLAIPAGPPLGSTLVNKVESLSSGIMVPVFASACVMKADILGTITGTLTNIHSFSLILIALIVLAKCITAFMVPIYCKIPFNDAVAIALIMNSKGIFELATFAKFTYLKAIPAEASIIILLAILVNAIVVPILLKFMYNPSKKYAGYQKRNITDLKPNSDLKILACIHIPENITSVINLIDSCHPTKDSPITAYVLHLAELVGRSSPIFISYQKQKQSTSGNSYSSIVVESFSQYEKSNKNAVSAEVFTAISPSNQMQEDICSLALDKLTSLIVLPLHREWCTNKFFHFARTLNCSVLESAPCSVGILVDHGHLRGLANRTSLEFSYHVGMIFMGGKDDREALILARRMAKDPRVKLTLIRFTSATSDCGTDWERVLDSEVLRLVKLDSSKEKNVIYKEEQVSYGVEITSVIESIGNDYDIFIVGRCQNLEPAIAASLRDQCEFPELGVMGDFLASRDFISRSSVLIIQQQRIADIGP